MRRFGRIPPLSWIRRAFRRWPVQSFVVCWGLVLFLCLLGNNYRSEVRATEQAEAAEATAAEQVQTAARLARRQVRVAARLARRQSETNYENSIASCEAGNPVRATVVENNAKIAVIRAEEAREATGIARRHDLELAKAERHGIKRIVSVEHVRPNGERICDEAINRP